MKSQGLLGPIRYAALICGLIFLIGLSLAVGNAPPVMAQDDDIDGADILATRVPPAAPTPGMIEQEITEITEATGLADNVVLGLAVEAWINLGVSLAMVLGGYLLSRWLFHLLGLWVSRQQFKSGVKEWLVEISTQVRWLILVGLLYLATFRLGFLNPIFRQALLDVYYVAGAILLTLVTWKTINFAVAQYRSRIDEPARLVELDPALILLTRSARIILVTVVITIILAHFGVNVAALSAALGIGGLAVSLAARETIADAIAGMIILFDRPFRVGDRIEIEEANTWGDVVEIGLRTTRIRTRDNRLIIVPNSDIVSNPIINYTYPDPFYRIQLDVGVAYGTNIEQVRQLLIDTTSAVAGVLVDRGVDALYLEMGDSAMIFRVRWWIESYVDTRRMVDKVNTALQHAFDTNGIDSPYPTQSILLRSPLPAADA